jgi:hypothetical protein
MKDTKNSRIMQVRAEINVNRTQAMDPYMGPKMVSFLLGAYLPQKMDLGPPIETELCQPFQKHVVALYRPHLRCNKPVRID